MSNKTAFVWDEKCFWHADGSYAFLAPVGKDEFIASGVVTTAQ